MKILYAGSITPNDSTLYRMWALQRLGHTLVPFNVLDFQPQSQLARKIIFRLAAGPHINRMNRDLLHLAEREAVAAVWADKVLGMQPQTLNHLREKGVVSVSYMIDNAFGPRRDPGWRLYRKCLQLYDLHVTQREVSLQQYKRGGARDVMKIQTAYEPTIHFPPPPAWSDKDRNRGVSFIGTPYDQRAHFLTRLWKEAALPVIVSGASMWKAALGPEATEAIYRDGELFQSAYREAIWRSAINLSFLTHSNQDEFVHKSFEIAACQGFLLAERSAGHSERFVEDEEAVFFSTFEECVEKIQRYLPDEQARNRIAIAGCQRSRRSGYDNDHQVSLIVERIQQIARSRAATLR